MFKAFWQHSFQRAVDVFQRRDRFVEIQGHTPDGIEDIRVIVCVQKHSGRATWVDVITILLDGLKKQEVPA